MSAGRRVAAVVAALTIAANLGTSYVLFVTGFLSRFRGSGITDRDVLAVYVFVVVFAAVTVSYVLVGFFLAGRPGTGRVAAVLLAGGATVAVWTFGYAVGGELVFHAPRGEFANAVLLLGPLAIGPGFALILPSLALVFPTGRLPSRRWTLPAGLVAGTMAAGTMVELILPGPITPEPRGSRNPFGIEGLPAGLAAAAYPLVAAAVVGAMVLGVAAVLTRYRTGDATLRQQLRWFIAAVLLAAVPLPISILPGVGGPQWALVASVGLILVPVSVGIAVVRYRLYEIDLIINRGLVYGVLGLIVAAAYVVLATALGRLAGGEGSPATTTVATVIAALVALAARQAVQQAIGRLFYGRRGDPLAVIGSVARRLESAGTPEGLLTDVVGDLREALKLDAVAVYAVDGGLLAGTARPEEGSRAPLSHQGELVGELRVWTVRGDELKPGDLRLLQDDLGPQLAVAIEAVRLKRDLQQARERLVAALEDERRRLRHDLHDGLGPTLTAITLRADAATNLLVKDPARARELLDELRGAAGDAIAEVRQLVHGLRPMALDELGLLGAIREQGIGVDRAGMPGPEVVIDDGLELPPLPAAVEVAAYRIATEAITNAIRHAGARHCRVRIIANAALEVEVTDDGHGWDGRLIPGVGIQSMRERAADLGGTLTIERMPGGGTSVLARLPLTSGSAS
ncbi:MAG TPA: sensor histidine kinase [Candidatus Limnocylindrales bacterium]|jgi:signal transduction histidine kinase